MELCSNSRISLCVVFVSVFFVTSVFGGECCSSYTDVVGEDHAAQWCSDYCCYEPKTLGFTLHCCDQLILRADQQYRSDFCIAWLNAYIYVPILVSLAVLGGLVTCCIFCCRRYRRHHGVIIQSGGGAPYVMIQQQMQQQTTVQDPYRAGYNQ